MVRMGSRELILGPWLSNLSGVRPISRPRLRRVDHIERGIRDLGLEFLMSGEGLPTSEDSLVEEYLGRLD